jgi:hypothetical protein
VAQRFEDDILTPRDVFTRIISEGYQVDYGRVAIVSSLVCG